MAMAPKKVFMLFALLYTLFLLRENTIPAWVSGCAWLPALERAHACGARFIEDIEWKMRKAHFPLDVFYKGSGGVEQRRNNVVQALANVEGSSGQDFFRV
jgi:hypothetical protein